MIDMSRLALEMFEEDFGGENARLKSDGNNPLLKEWPNGLRKTAERYSESACMEQIFGYEKKKSAVLSSSLVLSIIPTLCVSFKTKLDVFGIPLAIELVSGTYFFASYNHSRDRQKAYERSAGHHIESVEEIMKGDFYLSGSMVYPNFRDIIDSEMRINHRLAQKITKHPYCLP